jgi:hypothetical protein
MRVIVSSIALFFWRLRTDSSAKRSCALGGMVLQERIDNANPDT